MSESKTPRTDCKTVDITPVSKDFYSVKYCPSGIGKFVDTATCRQLETELAKAQSDLVEALDVIAAMTFGRMAEPIEFLEKHGRIK